MTEAGAPLLQTHRRSPFVDVEPLQLSEDISVDICSCHWSGSEDQWWCLWTSWESFEWGRRTNPTNSIFAFAAILIFTYVFGFVNNPDKNSAFQHCMKCLIILRTIRTSLNLTRRSIRIVPSLFEGIFEHFNFVKGSRRTVPTTSFSSILWSYSGCGWHNPHWSWSGDHLRLCFTFESLFLSSFCTSIEHRGDDQIAIHILVETKPLDHEIVGVG